MPKQPRDPIGKAHGVEVTEEEGAQETVQDAPKPLTESGDLIAAELMPTDDVRPSEEPIGLVGPYRTREELMYQLRTLMSDAFLLGEEEIARGLKALILEIARRPKKP